MNAYPDLRLLIAGEWRSRDGEAVLNPADESSLGTVPHASDADLEDAMEAAHQGFRCWRKMPPARREAIMLKAVDLLRSRAEAIGMAMTLEQGKPKAQGKGEVMRGCEFIEWDAHEGRRLYGRTLWAEPGVQHTAIRQPIGPVAAITAWNFPLSTPARKVGAALAAGCSVILKASEETPAGAVMLAQAFQDAGLPDGVLNVVFGDPAHIASRLIQDARIRLLSFTGSIRVGKLLAQQLGQVMKPAIMELGGHGPAIICEDADPRSSGAMAASAKARNSGQVCTAPTRFFVHRSIYDDFVQSFVTRASEISLGDGRDEQYQMGPMTNQRRLQAMEEYVADAVSHGAQLLCGGKRHGSVGYFFPLTALGQVPDQALAMREEPFGPLALINPYDDLAEAVEKANSLPYGLASYVFTESARNIDYISRNIEAGNLTFNNFKASVAETPFGGVKESGYGREGGTEGVDSYTITKNVSVYL